MRLVFTCCLVASIALLGACQSPAPVGGLPEAQQALAVHDYSRAFAILKPLAEAGLTPARRELAWLYFLGHGTSADVGQAIALLQVPAQSGDAESEVALGIIYESGRAGPNLEVAAYNLFRSAAAQNNGGAAMLLGGAYMSGRGVAKDEKEAIRWLVKAGEQGIPNALFVVADAYHTGKGLPKNDEQALYWLDVAKERLGPGDPARQGYQAMADQISGNVLVGEVQRLAAIARGWSPGKGALDSVLRDAGLPPDGTGAGGYLADAEAGPSGSGFVVNRAGDVITNDHVVHGCASAFLRVAGGQRLAASVVATDPAGDLAVVRPVTPLGDPVTLRERTLRQSERVTVAGFPLRGLLASDLNVSDGVVSALAGMGDNSRQIEITAPIQSGNSGGPVFDEDGAVVGVVEAALNSLALASVGALTENANFAIKVSSVREFLDARGIVYNAAPGGSAHGKVAELARRSTVAVECIR